MHKLFLTLTIVVSFVFGMSSVEAADAGISVTFSDDEVRIISAWYGDHGAEKGGKPAKGKRGGLPPGIAKNLARGKSLPPGIAKQYLPRDLQYRLPAPPAGYERIIVDGKILLVEVATQVIHDVLMDVVLG